MNIDARPFPLCSRFGRRVCQHVQQCPACGPAYPNIVAVAHHRA